MCITLSGLGRLSPLGAEHSRLIQQFQWTQHPNSPILGADIPILGADILTLIQCMNLVPTWQ